VHMRKLGSQGPEISVIGFGAWEAGGDWWGPNRSDEQVITAIHAGLDAGINWVDTAEVYGRGRSEELVGKALADRRDEVLIFTKVGSAGNGTGYRPDQVRAAIQKSLQRLGTDHADLYQIHWPDERVPVEETWGVMAELADEGRTRHIGVSNFDLATIRRCEAIRHVDSVQNKLSLLHQDDTRELLPSLERMGIGYLAYSPLGLGLLTGAITAETKLEDFRGSSTGPADFRPATLERNLAKVDRLRPVAERLNVTLAHLALAWVIHQTGVTAAIAGSRNAKHVKANAEAADLKLDEQTLEEITAIFGPGRPARG
jgi:aryl-alcohol dehydrogenase-like predicted oxidoreductase